MFPFHIIIVLHNNVLIVTFRAVIYKERNMKNENVDNFLKDISRGFLCIKYVCVYLNVSRSDNKLSEFYIHY